MTIETNDDSLITSTVTTIQVNIGWDDTDTRLNSYKTFFDDFPTQTFSFDILFKCGVNFVESFVTAPNAFLIEGQHIEI